MKESLPSPRVSERSGAGALARVASGAPETGLSTASLLAFIVGSFFAHGGAYAALSSLPEEATAAPRAPQELVFTVMAPEPEPIQTAPEPPPPPPVRVRAPRPVVAPEPAPAPAAPEPVVQQPEPAPIEHLATSTDSGLAVQGSVGPASASAAASLTGAEGGHGTAKAAPPDNTPRIDLRRLLAEWAAQVSQAVARQAGRHYPRAALRAHLEGTVLLSVRIGPSGSIDKAEVQRSSGHAQLDQAALDAARALGRVPPPPAALHRYLKPFAVPVNFTIR
jgi:protein TonB